MKKILFLALGCSLLFTPSCKDFLQKDPTSSPTDATFWQNTTHFDQALTGIYAQLRGGSNYTQSYSVSSNFLTTFNAFFDNFSDNSYGGNNNYAGQNEYLEDIISPENMPGMVGAAYSYCYAAIERINIFLDRLEENQDVNVVARKDQYRGEALALRGLMYHYLYTCYGAVPVVKEALAYDDGVGMYKEKSTKEEVYKTIIDDYTDAIALLPAGQNYLAAPGHITADAVRAFRARTRLYHAYDETGTANPTEMAQILTELDQITASYSLAPNVLNNFRSPAQRTCPEIMFSLRFLKPTYINQIDLFIGNWKTVQPTRDLVFAFPNADGSKYVPAAGLDTKERLTDADLASIFTGRDPRLAKFITHSGIYDFSDYPSSNAPVSSISVWNQDLSSTQFDVLKLVNLPLDYYGNGAYWIWHYDYGYQGDQDVVLMRWAHVLLMKAEAAYESGNTGAALGYINDLRTQRGIQALTDIDRDILRNEIRIETCFEGLRYFDMKRWRILGKMNGKKQDPNSSITVKVNPAHFDWPIPYSEIRLAKDNGVDLVQNPGYNNPTGN